MKHQPGSGLAGVLLMLLFGTTLYATGAGKAVAADRLQVVTTVPDLADVARQIGAKRIEVRSLSQGTENLHSVHVRPSMLVAMSKADLFLQMGLSLEAAWLPDLLLASRNSAIQPGSAGFANCSEGWEAIEVPATLSRQGGDLHPQGNPHFNLDPRAGRQMADCAVTALISADPAGEAHYRQGHTDYLARLSDAESRWQARRDELTGRKVAVYHLEYNYLMRYLGIEITAAIEPRPGIPPKPREVAEVIQTLVANKVPVVVTAAWSNNRQVADIGRKTGATVLELPNQVGGAPWADSWIALLDGVQQRLLEAYNDVP